MIAIYWLWAVLAFTFVPISQGFAITGVNSSVNAVTGERPVRLDILTLQNMGPAFDLYMLALQRFMQQDQSDPLSYYQIAGGLGNLMNRRLALTRFQ